jgi:hypothetical protein
MMCLVFSDFQIPVLSSAISFCFLVSWVLDDA